MFEYAPRYEEYLKGVDIPEPANLYSEPEFGSAGTRGKDDSLIHEIGTSVSKRHPGRNAGMDFDLDQNLSDREYTHKAYQEYLHRYLRCVKGVDDNIARLMAWLKENDLLDNTVIVYTSDQGMMLGEHDYIDKRWMYDESMRMPFLMRYPKRRKPGSKNDMMINNTDLAPHCWHLPESRRRRPTCRATVSFPRWRGNRCPTAAAPPTTATGCT